MRKALQRHLIDFRCDPLDVGNIARQEPPGFAFFGDIEPLFGDVLLKSAEVYRSAGRS